MKNLAQAALVKFGTLDVWINNTGVGTIGRFEDIPPEDYSRLIDINFKGVVYGSRAAMRQFRAQGYCTLINIGSIDSEVPLAYQAVYAASKADVLSLAQSLRQEIRLSGKASTIKIATIMPWAVDTPWWGHASNYSGGTPRMAAMDDPQKVVDAIFRAAIQPANKIPVGWKALGLFMSHRILPTLTERLSANIAHKYQMVDAPPAPHTHGTLYEPMESGRAVDDGVRARMRQEKQLKTVGNANG